jgi:hypothetical protein
MRDLISKVVTGSMIAGAALLVVACGSNEDANANNTAMNVEETLPANDMTNVDAMDGAGANLGAMDSTSNGTTTDTTSNTTETTTTTNTTTTNGM